jgi:PAS domain S-box-containing protein
VTARDLGEEGGDPPCWAHLDPHGEQARTDAAVAPEELADAVVAADAEGRIIQWNDAATLLFGQSPALGESLDVIIPERFRERHWEGYRHAIATGRAQHGDELLHVPALHADGGWISVEFTVTLLHDEQQRPVGVAASLRRDPSRPAERSSEGDPEQA